MNRDELLFLYQQGKRDFQYQNLANIDLSQTNLSEISLSYSDLSNSDLCGINLQNSMLLNVNFKNANLTYADLRNAQLQKSNLEGSDLRFANLSGANLNRASLYNILLDQTTVLNEKTNLGERPTGNSEDTIDLEEFIQLQDCEIQDLKHQINSLQNKENLTRNNQDNEIYRLRDQNQALENECFLLKEEVNQLHQSNTELNEEMLNVTENYQQSFQSLDEFRNKEQYQQNLLERYQTELSRLNQAINDLNVGKSNLQQINEKNQVDLDDLVTQNNELKSRLKDVSNRLKHLKKKNTSLPWFWQLLGIFLIGTVLSATGFLTYKQGKWLVSIYQNINNQKDNEIDNLHSQLIKTKKELFKTSKDSKDFKKQVDELTLMQMQRLLYSGLIGKDSCPQEYSFNINSKSRVDVFLWGLEEDADLFLLDSSNNELALSTRVSTFLDSITDYSLDNPGRYIVRINCISDLSTPYKLNIYVDPDDL